MDIREKLKKLSDEKYKKFSSALIPNCNTMLGVRLPVLRGLAKEIAKNNPTDFLSSPTYFFEEKMLQGMVIGQMNEPHSVILGLIENFIPKIDNWSICDSFCAGLKVVSKNKSFFWDFIKKYKNSKCEFEQRFFLVMAVFHYVEKDYIDEIFNILNQITLKDYYAKMAAAWLVSVCFVKFPNNTKKFLIKNNLDKETQNKAKRKILESFRVAPSDKLFIKGLKV